MHYMRFFFFFCLKYTDLDSCQPSFFYYYWPFPRMIGELIIENLKILLFLLLRKWLTRVKILSSKRKQKNKKRKETLNESLYSNYLTAIKKKKKLYKSICIVCSSTLPWKYKSWESNHSVTGQKSPYCWTILWILVELKVQMIHVSILKQHKRNHIRVINSDYAGLVLLVFICKLKKLYMITHPTFCILFILLTTTVNGCK